MREIIRGGQAQAVIEKNKEFLAMFSARERNALLRSIWRRCINEWRFKFLRRRLEASTVLKPPFNYTADVVSPMVDSGYMAGKAIWQGKINTTAKTNKSGTQQLTGTIGLPYGHPVIRDISRVFRVVPTDEWDWIGQRFADLFATEADQVVNETKARKNAKPRLRLSAGQRKRWGVQPRRRVAR